MGFAFQHMRIRTRIFRRRDSKVERESVVVSRLGDAWRSLDEFRAWARNELSGSLTFIENGVRFIEDIGGGRCCVYEVVLIS
jgi:hypothetical protein